jgi:uncharacterized membrane protein
MTQILLAYVVTLVAFLGIDYVWLAWIAKQTYASEMGGLLREQPNFVAAAAFYLLYCAGLVLFAVNPGLKGASVLLALGLGAALGLVAYGTYNLTALAVLNGFSMRLAIIDMAWGAFVSACAAAIAVGAMRWWSPE